MYNLGSEICKKREDKKIKGSRDKRSVKAMKKEGRTTKVQDCFLG